MPQVLKEEIRNQILNAAELEFEKNGYIGSSMNKIAKEANISVGNLYRYFDNKSTLFENVVGKTYRDVIEIFKPKSSNYDKVDEKGEIFKNVYRNIFSKKMIKFHKLYIDRKRKINILMNGSQGTNYENVSGMLKIEVEKWIKKLDKHIKFDGDVFLKAFSIAIVDGCMGILNNCKDDETALKEINRFICYMLDDFLGRLHNTTNI